MSHDPRSLGRAYVELMMKSVDSDADLVEERRRFCGDFINESNLKFLQDAVQRDREVEQVETLNCYLEDLGWFVPPILDEGERVALLEMTESRDGCDALIQRLLDWCENGGGRNIVETTSSSWAFSGRASLLEEALEAHEEGKYALSIPVFLSQGEGAFSGWLVSLGFDKPGLFKAAVATAFKNADWQNRDFTEIVLHAHLRSFSDTLSSQFTRSVWTAAQMKDLRTRYSRGYLSRHAVMHGLDTSYASPENSVKALFVIDVLREFFDYFQSGDSQDG